MYCILNTIAYVGLKLLNLSHHEPNGRSSLIKVWGVIGGAIMSLLISLTISNNLNIYDLRCCIDEIINGVCIILPAIITTLLSVNLNKDLYMYLTPSISMVNSLSNCSIYQVCVFYWKTCVLGPRSKPYYHTVGLMTVSQLAQDMLTFILYTTQQETWCGWYV